MIDDTLPGGPRERVIKYTAPFDRCDREEDYRTVWAAFTRRGRHGGARMIPSVLAAQVRRGVEEFLLTTFPITNPFFAGRLEELLRTDGSLFRGPYLSIKLPFLSGDPSKTLLPGIVPDGFVPYRHQERSWQRLRADTARSTIVATGTGSGKTECFLYPVLDYCHRHRGERGIKAIIVYPMNALATDQARRLAGAIHANPQLRGFVSAGLYVGGLEQGDEGTSSTRVMTEASLITDRDTLRQAPPDILLTNYKMLDYLLIRPADLPLWRDNRPETLKYFVVDELHTFDGAQGADLACLIRRIKHRVSTPTGHLCCVGTSATLGARAEAAVESGTEGMTPYLVSYARRVFGEVFDDDSVVGESLQTPDEFLKGQLVTRFSVPGPEHREALDPLAYATVDDYLRAQYRLWFGSELDTGNPSWRLAVSSELKGHAFFRNLLVVLGARALDVAALLHEIVETGTGIWAHRPGVPALAARQLPGARVAGAGGAGRQGRPARAGALSALASRAAPDGGPARPRACVSFCRRPQAGAVGAQPAADPLP